MPKRYVFPEAEEASDKPTGRCPMCGYRREETKHVRIFRNWICDLVQLDDDHWIHANLTEDGFDLLKGRQVTHRLIEDV